MGFEVVCSSSDRAMWLDHRRSGIGGSDAAGVLGRSPWSSPVSVFADKLLGDEKEDTEMMYWGRQLEPAILWHYAVETGRRATPAGQLLRNLERPWQIVTLDGEQWQDGREDPGFLEVKNTRWPIKGGVPEHYWIQMQHQFSVTGYEWGSFAVLVGGSEFFWCDVERDDDFIDNILIPAEECFWKLVEARGPTPDPDASEATTKALKRLFPGDNGKTIQLPPEFMDMDFQREGISEQIKELKEEKTGIDNAIKHALEEVSTGLLLDGRSYTFKADKNGKRTLRAPKPAE